MKKTFNILLLNIGILTLFSCVKVLDYDIPDDEKKIVVNGLISNYSPFSIHVNKSLHILDRLEIKPIDDALVQLFQDGVLVVETSEGNDGLYTSDFIGSCGHNYSLMVSAPNMKSATAICNILYPVPIEKVDTTKLITESYYFGYYYQSSELKCSILFNDPVETENYYELEAIVSYLLPDYSMNEDTMIIKGYEKISEYSMFISNDPVIEYSMVSNQITLKNNEDENIIGEKILFSDRIINGLEYNLNISFLSDFYIPGNEDIDSVKLTIHLKSVTKDYFLYMQLLERHLQVKDDPFSEPSQAYTNIKNGLGILAGMSESVFSIEFNKQEKP